MRVSFSGGWMWRWRRDNSPTRWDTCWCLSCEVRRREKLNHHQCLSSSMWSLTSPRCWARATPCSRCRSWDAPLSSDHWTVPGWSDHRVRSSSRTWANQRFSLTSKSFIFILPCTLGSRVATSWGPPCRMPWTGPGAPRAHCRCCTPGGKHPRSGSCWSRQHCYTWCKRIDNINRHEHALHALYHTDECLVSRSPRSRGVSASHCRAAGGPRWDTGQSS